ncbi:MAG: hypothetical protein P4M08_13040 [Oligoflexia bacterium]|nr:hypothetical protein [Oligoflexia bacterium]
MGLSSKALDEIIAYLCDEIGGDWLLAGGALVRLEFDAERGTEDVDLVRVSHPELSDEMAKHTLFKWLIARGSGPEWVNSAVEPFVREVPNWQNELVFVRAGRKGRILRPTLTLFAYLKLRRGTDIDLSDIRAAVAKCPEGFDERKFRLWADLKTLSRFEQHRAALGL